MGQYLPSSSSTVCFQSCQLSVRIYSYLLGCCPSISVLVAPFFSSPVQPRPSFFLIICLLILSWHVRTNAIDFVSGILTFGTLWHPLVLSCFWHGPFWSYPLSIEASSFPLRAICSRISSNRPTLCSICHRWLDQRLIHLVFQFDGYLFVGYHARQLLPFHPS